MAQLYRLNEPSGIKIEATGQIIFPGDPEWAAYESWLAEQPGSETIGGPLPPGTGLLPFEEPTQTLPQQQAEAFARVDGVAATQRTTGTMDALGHTWRLDASFLLSIAIHNAAPGLPVNFALPDVNHVLVPLTQGQLNQLLRAISDYLYAVEAQQAALITEIQTSPAPLGVVWP